MDDKDLEKRVKELKETTKIKEDAERKRLEEQDAERKRLHEQGARRRIQEAMQGQANPAKIEQPGAPQDQNQPGKLAPSGGANHPEIKQEKKGGDTDLHSLEKPETIPPKSNQEGRRSRLMG